MIDIENEVINKIITDLDTAYGSNVVSVKTDPNNTPSSFPCVTVIEEDNSVDTNGIDSGAIENFVNVSYEINVYSNAGSKRKSQCKDIRNKIDSTMVGMGFQRSYSRPLPTESPDLYRIFLRYVAKVDANKIIYER